MCESKLNSVNCYFISEGNVLFAISFLMLGNIYLTYFSFEINLKEITNIFFLFAMETHEPIKRIHAPLPHVAVPFYNHQTSFYLLLVSSCERFHIYNNSLLIFGLERNSMPIMNDKCIILLDLVSWETVQISVCCLKMTESVVFFLTSC